MLQYDCAKNKPAERTRPSWRTLPRDRAKRLCVHGLSDDDTEADDDDMTEIVIITISNHLWLLLYFMMVNFRTTTVRISFEDNYSTPYVTRNLRARPTADLI